MTPPDPAKVRSTMVTTLKRLFFAFPLLIATYVLTQTTTRPVSGLARMIESAGFHVMVVRKSTSGSFLGLIAEKTGPP